MHNYPMLLFDWKTMHRGQDCWTKLLALRHHCFVERQGYEVPSHQGLEWDSFDTPYTRYGLWCLPSGKAASCFRLIPSRERYMIPELWPQLLDTAAPRDPGCWEMSRLGIDGSLTGADRKLAVAAIMHGLIAEAEHHGIERVIFCSHPAMMRRMLRGVTEVRPLGPAQWLGPHWVQCQEVALTPEALERARQQHPWCQVTRL